MFWTRNLLPRSLRARLIFSFGVLIFLSLFLAGTTTVYLLKQQQEATAREKVGRLAEPIALRAAFLEAGGSNPQQIEQALQQEYDVRILLVDRRDGSVVGDTKGTLRGATISQQVAQVSQSQPGQPAQPTPAPDAAQPPRRPGDPRFLVQRLQQPSDNFLLFTASPVRSIRLPGIGIFVPAYQAVVAVEESSVKQAWRDLLPRLFLAGGIAFFASVIASSLLARSITQPLRLITEASEEMAKGRYDQRIPGYGGSEEVGRLAQAFNDMARQVSGSHRTLRDFLANVSHELKTPLTSIQGFSQAMVDGSLDRPQDFVEAGRIINDEAIRMRGLVDDLLYLSQVEAGEIVMHFDPINPNDLLLATSERFERRAGQADVALDVQTGAATSISADARRLE